MFTCPPFVPHLYLVRFFYPILRVGREVMKATRFTAQFKAEIVNVPVTLRDHAWYEKEQRAVRLYS